MLGWRLIVTDTSGVLILLGIAALIALPYFRVPRLRPEHCGDRLLLAAAARPADRAGRVPDLGRRARRTAVVAGLARRR